MQVLPLFTWVIIHCNFESQVVPGLASGNPFSLWRRCLLNMSYYFVLGFFFFPPFFWPLGFFSTLFLNHYFKLAYKKLLQLKYIYPLSILNRTTSWTNKFYMIWSLQSLLFKYFMIIFVLFIVVFSFYFCLLGLKNQPLAIIFWVVVFYFECSPMDQLLGYSFLIFLICLYLSESIMGTSLVVQ